MTYKAPFCTSLRLTITVFSRLLKKAILMALWTKAITCDKAGFKSRFCQEQKAGKNIISVNPVILSNFSSCSSCASWLKNLFNQRNPRLIKNLRAFKALYNCKETFTDVMSALQIHLFMQNKANFRKVKFDVNKVLTKDYEQMDTWSIRKTKPIKANSKPIKANSKPIKANIMPKQSQYKPKQTQFLSAIYVVVGQGQKMKITGRHKPFAYEAEPNGIDKTSCILSTNLVTISKYTRSNKMQLSENCCPNFNEGAHI